MSSIENVFRLVWDASWRTTFIVVVLMVVRPFLQRRISARVLVWAWLAVAARLLFPVSIPVAWSPFMFLQPTHLAPAIVRQPQVITTADGTDLPSREHSNRPALTEFRTTSFEPAGWSLGQVATLAWATGAILLLVVRLGASWRFARRLRTSAGNADAALESIVTAVAVELNVRRVTVIETNAITAPALHGVLRPKLLFPPRFLEQVSPAEARLIVAHELGHCRYHDLAANSLLHFVRTVHWFNPLVWFACSAARSDCEIACDEFVVSRLRNVEAQAYGATLLKILGMVRLTDPAPLTLGIVGSKRQLKRRLERIVAYKATALFRSAVVGALLGGLVGISLTREARAQSKGQAEVQALEYSRSLFETVDRTPSSVATAPNVTTAVPNVTTAAPAGWRKDGNRPNAYVVGVDRGETHDGLPSAYVRSLESTVNGFGGMIQRCAAGDFLGKRLRFSAWMKTANTNEGGARLWFRVDGEGGRKQVLQFDNMENRPVLGTTGWQQYSVVLDVPANAVALAYGFLVRGTGQAWVSEAKLEEVGTDVPDTNTTVNAQPDLPKTPVNLTFSGAPALAEPNSAPPSLPSITTDPGQLGARFPYDIDFSTDKPTWSRFMPGDNILITSVRGDRKHIEPGGRYLVEGTYTLASTDRAHLGLNITAPSRNAPGAHGPGGQSTAVARGTGRFSLIEMMQYPGSFHVSYYPADGGESWDSIYFKETSVPNGKVEIGPTKVKDYGN